MVRYLHRYTLFFYHREMVEQHKAKKSFRFTLPILIKLNEEERGERRREGGRRERRREGEGGREGKEGRRREGRGRGLI